MRRSPLWPCLLAALAISSGAPGCATSKAPPSPAQVDAGGQPSTSPSERPQAAAQAEAKAKAEAVAASEATAYEGPVIDLHTHVFFGDQSGGLEGDAGRPKALLAAIDDPRLARVGVIVIAPRPGIERTRELNDALAELVATDPERLIGIGTVHPADGEAALAELERFEELGLVMLKLHPVTQSLDLASAEVLAVVAKAAELDLPILLDFSGALAAGELDPYVMLAAQNPTAKLILAHMGGTKFDDVLLLASLQDYDWYRNNIWLELSGIAQMYAGSPYVEQLMFVIREVGIDRVLFGSDYPFTGTPGEAIIDVERLGFTAEEQRSIFHDNAAALLER